VPPAPGAGAKAAAGHPVCPEHGAVVAWGDQQDCCPYDEASPRGRCSGPGADL